MGNWKATVSILCPLSDVNDPPPTIPLIDDFPNSIFRVAMAWHSGSLLACGGKALNVGITDACLKLDWVTSFIYDSCIVRVIIYLQCKGRHRSFVTLAFVSISLIPLVLAWRTKLKVHSLRFQKKGCVFSSSWDIIKLYILDAKNLLCELTLK